MRILGKSFNSALVIAACVAVLALAGGFSFSIPSFFGFAWQGYYTVLLDGRADIKEVSQSLRGAGFDGFVSAATASVEISDFDVNEEVLIADLSRRLLPEDPRMDDFLARSGSLFRSVSQDGGGGHILYFPVRESPLALAFKLAKVFGDYSWSIVEWQSLQRLVLLLLVCIIAGVCVYCNQGMRLAACALALPWLGFLVHGDPGVFAAGILVYFSLVYCAEETFAAFDNYVYFESGFWTRSLMRRALAGGFLVLSAILLAAFCGGGALSFVPLACGFAGSIALAVLAALYRRYTRTHREHRLFMPLSILPRIWKGKKKRTRAELVPLVLVCCLLAAPLVFRLSGGAGQMIPKPHDVPGISGFSRENLRQLWALPRENALPDFSVYLCHRAYQQGFFYGYPPEFPLPDAKLILTHYTEEGRSIVKTEETLLTFGEMWYKGELEKAEKSPLGNLLLRQGVSGIAPDAVRHIGVDRAWVIRYALITAPGLLLFLFMTSGLALKRFPCVKNFKFRRNQQEA
jgi:hypothetical protein